MFRVRRVRVENELRFAAFDAARHCMRMEINSSQYKFKVFPIYSLRSPGEFFCTLFCICFCSFGIFFFRAFLSASLLLIKIIVSNWKELRFSYCHRHHHRGAVVFVGGGGGGDGAAAACCADTLCIEPRQSILLMAHNLEI